MLKTLHGRLSLALLLLLIPAGALYVWSTVAISQRYVQEVIQEANVGLAGRLVQDYKLMVQKKVDKQAFAPVIATLMMTNPTVDLYILGSGGGILASSVALKELKRKAVSLAPVETFVRGPIVYPLLGENPRDTAEPRVFSAARIPAQGPLEGYLYIVLANQLHDSAAAMVRSSTIVRLGVWAGLAGLGVIFAAGVLIFTLITRRLKHLTTAMMHFQESNFTDFTLLPPVQTRYSDEVTNLGLVFNSMAARMTEQVASLKEGDRLRRELVANVSHDLRTPLTTLQGYLETVQLPTLSEADKKHYLEVATKQSVRLGKLVGELFELAKLEANAVQLHQEPFSLAELCQDVVGEFQVVAEQRGITLTADLSVTPLVVADVGFTERTVQNLLDNALRYTPPGGTVTVTLEQSREGVTVEVKDTGAGISPGELPHIFERYYQAPRTARAAETGETGAGLGLAISQRMLELHGSRLRVSSKLGVGTTFSFTLPTPLQNDRRL